MEIVKILILTLLIGAVAVCVKVGELREESRSVQLGEAESVELELKMGSGELRLQGGAGELMEGTFSYNVDRWKPEVDYHVFGKKGMLSVEQGKASGMPVGKAENRWDIRLSNEVPIDLGIDFGAGEGKLDLRGLRLESLDINMGVGDLTIDLSGKHSHSLRVTIDGGVGSGTIYLPRNIGVRVKVDGGIGSVDAEGLNKTGHVYTNDEFGKTDVSIDVKVSAGIGSIDLIVK